MAAASAPRIMFNQMVDKTRLTGYRIQPNG
jgi:hypothetical protein